MVIIKTMKSFGASYPEKTPLVRPQTPSGNNERDVFEPKWKHVQEDLKYMFMINVDNESDLIRKETKDRMKDAAIQDLKDGQPFSLDYFVKEGLLSHNDFSDEELVSLKLPAFHILDPKVTRNLIARTALKELFIEVGILSEIDVRSAEMIH